MPVLYAMIRCWCHCCFTGLESKADARSLDLLLFNHRCGLRNGFTFLRYHFI